ncbi:MAG: hypothetical protein V4472_03895 [Pseudomonadota bacterium]
MNLSILGEIASDRKIYAFQADAVTISAMEKPEEAPFGQKRCPVPQAARTPGLRNPALISIEGIG